MNWNSRFVSNGRVEIAERADSKDTLYNDSNLHSRFLKPLNNIKEHKLMSSWHASDYVNGSKIIHISSKSSL